MFACIFQVAVCVAAEDSSLVSAVTPSVVEYESVSYEQDVVVSFQEEEQSFCLFTYGQEFYVEKFYKPFKAYIGELYFTPDGVMTNKDEILKKLNDIKGTATSNGVSLWETNDLSWLPKTCTVSNTTEEGEQVVTVVGEQVTAVVETIKTNLKVIINAGFDSLGDKNLSELVSIEQTISLLEESGFIKSSDPRELFRVVISDYLCDCMRLVEFEDIRSIFVRYQADEASRLAGETSPSLKKFTESVTKLSEIIISSRDQDCLVKDFTDNMLEACNQFNLFLKEIEAKVASVDYDEANGCKIKYSHPLSQEVKELLFTAITKARIVCGMSLLIFEGLRFKADEGHVVSENSLEMMKELPYLLLAYPANLSTISKLENELKTSNPSINPA
jgi:hypothetical protein